MERERIREASGRVRRICAVCPRGVSRKGQVRHQVEGRSVVRSPNGEWRVFDRDDEGVAKARDFRRRAENGGRWSVVDFDKFVGGLGSGIREQRAVSN